MWSALCDSSQSTTHFEEHRIVDGEEVVRCDVFGFFNVLQFQVEQIKLFNENKNTLNRRHSSKSQRNRLTHSAICLSSPTSARVTIFCIFVTCLEDNKITTIGLKQHVDGRW